MKCHVEHDVPALQVSLNESYTEGLSLQMVQCFVTGELLDQPREG